MKTHLIIIAAALLPTLAIVWHRVSQMQEASGNVRLLLAVQDDLRGRELLNNKSTVFMETWLKENSSHPQAENVRTIIRLRDDPQRPGKDEALAKVIEASLK